MEIQRDWQGRPLIKPVGGGKPVPYTRVSTLAKALDDTYSLNAWRTRMAVLGVSTNRHLMQQVAAIASRFDDPVKQGRRELDAITQEAAEAAGVGAAAATGTALHDYTEQIDAGRELAHVPSEFIAPLRAYQAGTKGLESVGSEVFVVNDTLGVAGSLDRLWRLPDGRVVVGDLKTGDNEPKYPLGVTTQVAMYATGQRYDPETGTRAELHPDLDPTAGLLVHLPIRAPEPRCDLYLLDLTLGLQAAHLALEVRQMRKAKPIAAFEVPEPTLFDEEIPA